MVHVLFTYVRTCNPSQDQIMQWTHAYARVLASKLGNAKTAAVGSTRSPAKGWPHPQKRASCCSRGLLSRSSLGLLLGQPPSISCGLLFRRPLGLLPPQPLAVIIQPPELAHGRLLLWWRHGIGAAWWRWGGVGCGVSGAARSTASSNHVFSGTTSQNKRSRQQLVQLVQPEWPCDQSN